jgi:hypothetical protein
MCHLMREWPIPMDQQFEGSEVSLARAAEALNKIGGQEGYFIDDRISYGDVAVTAHIK